MTIPTELILPFLSQFATTVIVPVLGAWILKKVKDRDVREAIASSADAALVFAIRKSKQNGAIADIAELVREVVKEILTDPNVPNVAKNDPTVVERAAAAAVARSGVVLPVQRIHVNPDGTLVPETMTIGR